MTNVKTRDTEQPDQEVEHLATKMAKSRTNIAMWDLNIVFLLFAVLVIVVIMISLDVDTIIVAPVAIIGLILVWVMGRRRGKRMYQQFFTEEYASLQQETDKEVTTLAEPLTAREIEILSYVSQGFANKRIAHELGISVNTVKIFMRRIMSKLNASDRTGAVVIAIKNGIISIA